MSLHETIVTAMQRFIDERADCVVISPTAVASATYAAFAETRVEAHIEYGCIEHFKNIARKVLGRRYDDDGEENAAYSEQGELFSGCLQTRYPTPRKGNGEPAYKLLECLTDDELAWNIRSLTKSADARTAHADALRAFRRSRVDAA